MLFEFYQKLHKDPKKRIKVMMKASVETGLKLLKDVRSILGPKWLDPFPLNPHFIPGLSSDGLIAAWKPRPHPENNEMCTSYYINGPFSWPGFC